MKPTNTLFGNLILALVSEPVKLKLSFLCKKDGFAELSVLYRDWFSMVSLDYAQHLLNEKTDSLDSYDFPKVRCAIKNEHAFVFCGICFRSVGRRFLQIILQVLLGKSDVRNIWMNKY